MKIIVYPGSFDPLHNGHLLIARHAQAAIGADEVLFLLSPSTVWKKVLTPFSVRAAMLEAALPREGFSLSRLEEGNEGKKNYTYLTLNKLKAARPHDELYLLLGADQATVFDKWMNPDEIASTATLLVYKRQGSKINRANIERFKMQVIEGPLSNTSSSKIRVMEDLDVPSSVLEAIGKQKLYFASWINKRLSDKRYFHSFEVAKLSRLIALSNGLDGTRAFIAGFLHDIAKEVPEATAYEIMKNHYQKYLTLPKWTYHQFVGEYLAKHEFEIKDKEILRAIKYHATGAKKMKSYGKIVYAADKIEPTRGFDSSDLIAAVVNNLESGFVTVLKANKEYLVSKGLDVDNELTKACFATYLKD